MQKATLSWGPEGVREAHDRKDLIVVVDVLRFSSTVTTAVANGFTIVPSSDLRKAESLSLKTGMPVSGRTGAARYSLSPLDYVNPKDPEELILLSPNGAACVEAAAGAPAFIGCFLNARAVARVLRGICESEGRNVTVVAAGEAVEDQYDDLCVRRFAIEDYLASGLIISELRLERTPEATVCVRAWDSSAMDYATLVRSSESGQWLAEHGHEPDISHCVQRGIYDAVPILRDGRIVAHREHP